MTYPYPPNFRDASCGRVRRGFLFRGASPHLATENELEALRVAGITTFIDLRSEVERSVFGDGFLAELGIRPVRMPLFDTLPDDVMTRAAEGRLDPGDLYVEQLRQVGDRIGAAVTAIAVSPGPCLVTCAAGRDRTGLVIAVTLLVLNVDPDSIVADYIATDTEIDRLMQRMLSGPTPEVFRRAAPAAGTSRCDPAHMHRVISWLHHRGGAGRYLTDHGVRSEVVQRLHDQLKG